ncbi:MAG: FAD-dependent oxidoreductase [Telmatospirillum sp.]|nr:FAD-dependent oxidoreductase [Telmatospirillum sp.]
MSIRPAADVVFEAHIPVLIVGAGAAGHVAALACRDAGIECAMLERDPQPQGSTALSSGLVPAANTAMQRAKNIDDTPALFAADIQRKAKGQADLLLVARLSETIGATVDWLAERHAIPFELVEGFLYPGHSALRMHGTKRRTGAELMDGLVAAAAAAGAETLTNAHVVELYADGDGRVRGVGLERPDGTRERLGCDALVLACNGFGGNADMVAQFLPEMREALYFGHTGNRGDAVAWGQALGAATRHLGAYQGHGSVADPHGILISWAVMMEGGIQVNRDGNRFSNEHLGYSEQSVAVLQQPGRIAFSVYDGRCHAAALQFEEYRQAVALGAVREFADAQALAAAFGLPPDNLARAIAETISASPDPWGRDFSGKPPLAPPYWGVRVTGALFHTQGGLVVDEDTRVCRADGTKLPNLFAAGGAACGVSGPAVWGYLSGNGLLSAVGLGRLAGAEAARSVSA